jgi:hypothetical protein
MCNEDSWLECHGDRTRELCKGCLFEPKKKEMKLSKANSEYYKAEAQAWIEALDKRVRETGHVLPF